MATNGIVMEKSNLDTLAEVLFDGKYKAADVKTMPGSGDNFSVEEKAKELLTSLKRAGVVRDGTLLDVA